MMKSNNVGRIRYAVLWLLCLVMVLAGCASTGAETRPQEDSEAIGRTDSYTVSELSFERDGMNIYGNLYMPAGTASSYPVAVIAHGFESSYSYTSAYAEYLSEAGIAAYVFDFCGGSSHSESDGSMEDMSVLTEKADLEAVLDGIIQLDFVDRDNLFLMGESQGGMVAALLAAERAAEVNALVLFYPAFVIPDYARELYSDASQVPEEPQAMGGVVGRRYFTDVIDLDVYDEISGYGQDVLIVHGDSDSVVPLSCSERAIREYPSAQLLVIEGAGHGFAGSDLQEACTAAAAFMKTHISQTE